MQILMAGTPTGGSGGGGEAAMADEVGGSEDPSADC